MLLSYYVIPSEARKKVAIRRLAESALLIY